MSSSVEVGEHYVFDFNFCDRDVLNSESILRSVMLSAVKESGATIIGNVFHSFSPVGITGIIAIAESHVSIHTWPEHNYAAVDIFSCSKKMKIDVVVSALKRATGAQKVVSRKLSRGPSDDRSVEHDFIWA